MVESHIRPCGVYREDGSDPAPVARDLLGDLLVRKTHDLLLGGTITDTEAYGPPCADPLVQCVTKLAK